MAKIDYKLKKVARWPFPLESFVVGKRTRETYLLCKRGQSGGRLIARVKKINCLGINNSEGVPRQLVPRLKDIRLFRQVCFAAPKRADTFRHFKRFSCTISRSRFNTRSNIFSNLHRDELSHGSFAPSKRKQCTG